MDKGLSNGAPNNGAAGQSAPNCRQAPMHLTDMSTHPTQPMYKFIMAAFQNQSKFKPFDDVVPTYTKQESDGLGLRA